MDTNNRCFAPVVCVLIQCFPGPSVANSQEVPHKAWRDPYTLSLQSPEQYKLAPSQPAVAPSSSNQATGRAAELFGHPFEQEIARVANEFNVEPALVHAVIQVESGYNPSARSPRGAQGLMQLLPETARRFGVPTADLLWRPELNIRAGVAYLRSLMELFEQDLDLALAAYNAGENAVLRYGRQIPPFPETRNYVPKVLAIYNRLRPSLEPEPSATPTGRVRIQYPPPLPQALPDETSH